MLHPMRHALSESPMRCCALMLQLVGGTLGAIEEHGDIRGIWMFFNAYHLSKNMIWISMTFILYTNTYIYLFWYGYHLMTFILWYKIYIYIYIYTQLYYVATNLKYDSWLWKWSIRLQEMALKMEEWWLKIKFWGTLFSYELWSILMVNNN